MSGKVPTGVYVNQSNFEKLKLCIQNLKPCSINVGRIQRKGVVRIDVLLMREQVETLSGNSRRQVKLTKPMLKKYSIKEMIGGFIISPPFSGGSWCCRSLDGWNFIDGKNC